tara:strand:+ start:299 stop:844 length:546 start_codon:yes stop_codon:yes gene_type:complete
MGSYSVDFPGSVGGSAKPNNIEILESTASSPSFAFSTPANASSTTFDVVHPNVLGTAAGNTNTYVSAVNATTGVVAVGVGVGSKNTIAVMKEYPSTALNVQRSVLSQSRQNSTATFNFTVPSNLDNAEVIVSLPSSDGAATANAFVHANINMAGGSITVTADFGLSSAGTIFTYIEIREWL